MKTRRLVVESLAVVSMLSLAACSSGSASGPPSDDPSASGSPAAVVATIYGQGEPPNAPGQVLTQYHVTVPPGLRSPASTPRNADWPRHEWGIDIHRRQGCCHRVRRDRVSGRDGLRRNKSRHRQPSRSRPVRRFPSAKEWFIKRRTTAVNQSSWTCRSSRQRASRCRSRRSPRRYCTSNASTCPSASVMPRACPSPTFSRAGRDPRSCTRLSSVFHRREVPA